MPLPVDPRRAEAKEAVSLDDQLAKESDQNTAAVRWQRKAEERQREIRRLTGRVDDLTSLVANISQVKPDDMVVPHWLKPPKKDGTHHGTPVLMLSDLHLDERVDVYEMDRLNKYDRDIAHARLERVGNGAVKLLHEYVTGLTLDGIVVPLNGDIITGVIHDELARTNEAPVPATIAHWVPHLASLLRHLADEFGNVFVPTTDGNHDRTYAKISAKQRSQSSNAWIIYNWLADTLRDDPRITFSISTSPHARWDVYGTRFLQTHGDAFRSSGGVGGLYPSMLKYLLRMHSLYSTARDDFDYCLLGHWHQLLWGPDFIVNGSLKGYDEYARHNGFGFERPAQALFIVTPENGITNRIDVFADDPADEGWARKRRTRKATR